MAISKMLAVYMLLPALVSCESANLRGTAANDTENRTSIDEIDDVEVALFNSTDVDTDPLNGTDDLQALQASAIKICSETRKANQCLMVRAKKAKKLWGSWTEYRYSDRNLRPGSLKTDCSGFVNWAIKGCGSLGTRALDAVSNHPGSGRKRARNFYRAFGSSGRGRWCRVEDFRKVDTGDVLVYEIKTSIRSDREPGDSGHIMIAYRSPFERGVTRDGKLVFAQKIIDSTKKPHFDYGTFEETRRDCKNKKCGVGVGYIYVWTDRRGHVLAMRLRGKNHRNHLDCQAKKDGKQVNVPCFPTTNERRHNYRIGRLRN